MDQITGLGETVRDVVLDIAKLLIVEGTPGFVVLFLLAGLLAAVGLYLSHVLSASAALRALQRRLAKTQDPSEFTARINEIDADMRNSRGRKHADAISKAWSEYRETMIPYGEGSDRILRNSVRPSAFFNVEDLQMGPGFFRIMPGLFVTFGLFLTFLGLIAALGVIDVKGDPEQMKEGLEKLLQAASAKFIMSLTGLLCSILFTVVLRYGLNRIERDIHKTCHEIETRLSFLSLEDIAVDQLTAMKEQREHFRTIGMELVAEIARPLREDLPKAISDSISSAISPVLQQVQQAGTNGVGSMVEDLSARFSNDVAKALATAGKSIEQAGDRISSLAERMNESSGTMNREMEGSIARLVETLDSIKEGMTASAEQTQSAFSEGAERMLSVMSGTLQDIRTNTGEGAKAISDAAKDMRAAAQSFKEELSEASKTGATSVAGKMSEAGELASSAIQQASSSLLETFGKSAGDLSELTSAMAEKFASDVISPISELRNQLGDLNQKIAAQNDEFRRLAEAVRSGADATSSAATSFRSASGDLVAAANPIRSSVDDITRNIVELNVVTQRTADTLQRGAETTAKSAASALESASAILGGEQQAIQAALAGVREAITRMKDQGQRLDDLDSKLSAAFESYSQHVTSALDLMVEHVRKIQGEFSPALDTMREIVDQAEKFSPASRINR